MSVTTIRLGYLPLLDAAPFIIAQELGFAAEERVALDLRPAASWSALRDMLSYGQVEAASMLSPIPIASALGLGGMPGQIDALMVTSLGGEGIVASALLADLMRARGYAFELRDAAQARDCLKGSDAGPLRIATPFPFSIHAELIYRWLGEDVVQQTLPPSQMGDAMARGEVDLFCVGEPWASLAAEQGAGVFLLPGTAIWKAPPDKVLAMRHADILAGSPLVGPLMRLTWRACHWLSNPANQMVASEILGRPEWLDMAPELLERVLQSSGVEFFHGCATFPWRSQADWIGQRLVQRHMRGPDLDQSAERARARAVFRSDLYRQILGPVGAGLPSASSRLEGGIGEMSLLPAASGRVQLHPDTFFDGAIFDPDH